jgi:hypothetical protein
LAICSTDSREGIWNIFPLLILKTDSWVWWLVPVFQLLRRQGSEGLYFKGTQGKKFLRPLCPISTNKPGMVVHICNPSYTGGIDRRIAIQDWPLAKSEILPEK